MERILVVENNAPLCWLIERMLRGRYIVTLLNNAYDAVAWLNNGNICDIIITDLQLPGMTGFDLIQFVKQNGLYSKIPTIILSADDDRIDECKTSGASSYLVKPFNPQKLIEAVRTNLLSNAPVANCQ